jgi:hypothetical protein
MAPFVRQNLKTGNEGVGPILISYHHEAAVHRNERYNVEKENQTGSTPTRIFCTRGLKIELSA